MFSVFVIFAISAIVWCGGYDKGDFNILQGHGRPKREPPPPYLGSVTEQARNEYFAIMSNMNQTIAQQKQNVLIWAQKNGIEKQVQEYDSVMTKLRNELKNNITNFVSQLPSAAQQYAALMVDENQTSAEQFKKLQDLCSQNPQSRYGAVQTETTR
ncbi:hypothetical protein KIN20_027782 [Parelaphostrongylus tenuis]|uniref:SXP/RAL-2 family protein Ani s 5-like cation-binding domain-containing protein n=1 Tax=Parelaphostrongylus tenuis TaxID=148309 RepID=A0AAD5R055_PARTN|nr:hypothetical protein KIN20_027782 [Parelaphostrongylus tenuis]